MVEKTTDYRLRNQPQVTFSLQASCQGGGVEGALARADICRNDGLKFRYQVRFQGEYCATKANFDAEMYLETALSLMKSQIESHRLEDSEILIEVGSGLPRTRVGVKFSDWPERPAAPPPPPPETADPGMPAEEAKKEGEGAQAAVEDSAATGGPAAE